MKNPVATTAILAMLLSLGSPVRLETKDISELDPVSQMASQIRWPRKTIQLAFSTSLNSPGPNIKAGSDVVGAARRALARWSSNANVNFVVTWSDTTSVSPSSGGDGISLITVADTLDNESFNADSTTGRTRIFYDPETGSIAEADVSINPRPVSQEGADLQFSTDGTPGTYDLEATFTHEIGHLLGLDHSVVLASTMQSRQAFNGTYGLPAFTERTLSEDDRQRVRTLYGSKLRLGKIEGRLIDNQPVGTSEPVQAFNVWAENIATGRVVASTTTSTDGTYRLEGLVGGQYRVLAAPRGEDLANAASAEATSASRKVRSFELSSQATVKSDVATMVNYNLLPQTSASSLTLRWIGLGEELSTVALPVEPGKRIKIYLGGEGIDQVPGTSITVSSPYFTVDPTSLTREQLSTPFPVISIELNVSPNAPFGDYSVRLQSNAGELAYLPGALTVDPGAAYTAINPVDDPHFLFAQQYADLLGRSPERDQIEKLSGQLAQCGNRAECLRTRRLDISTNMFLQNAMQSNSLFVNGLYLAGLGRRPRLNEFEADRNLLASRSNETENVQLQFALAFVQRPEFERKYPATMKAGQFVDALISATKVSTSLDLTTERINLMNLYDDTTQARAAILSQIVTGQAFLDAQYNQAFVQSQYFSYLRRDPDEGGLSFWINVLKGKPLRDTGAARSMVCAFVNSSEYQLRFGSSATHSGNECN